MRKISLVWLLALGSVGAEAVVRPSIWDENNPLRVKLATSDHPLEKVLREPRQNLGRFRAVTSASDGAIASWFQNPNPRLLFWALMGDVSSDREFSYAFTKVQQEMAQWVAAKLGREGVKAQRGISHSLLHELLSAYDRLDDYAPVELRGLEGKIYFAVRAGIPLTELVEVNGQRMALPLALLKQRQFRALTLLLEVGREFDFDVNTHMPFGAKKSSTLLEVATSLYFSETDQVRGDALGVIIATLRLYGAKPDVVSSRGETYRDWIYRLNAEAWYNKDHSRLRQINQIRHLFGLRGKGPAVEEVGVCEDTFVPAFSAAAQASES